MVNAYTPSPFHKQLWQGWVEIDEACRNLPSAFVLVVGITALFAYWSLLVAQGVVGCSLFLVATSLFLTV